MESVVAIPKEHRDRGTSGSARWNIVGCFHVAAFVQLKISRETSGDIGEFRTGVEQAIEEGRASNVEKRAILASYVHIHSSDWPPGARRS
jgi:hypothetical protein